MDIDILDGIDKIISKDKLSKLSIDNASDIAYLSKGLNKDEILSYYGLDESDINDEDKKFLKIIITRGKTRALAEATRFFFEAMKDNKTGASTCLSYLTRFSPTDWNVSAEDGKKEVYVFKMVESK